jgi:hypothetical protein
MLWLAAPPVPHSPANVQPTSSPVTFPLKQLLQQLAASRSLARSSVSMAETYEDAHLPQHLLYRWTLPVLSPQISKSFQVEVDCLPSVSNLNSTLQPTTIRWPQVWNPIRHLTR